MKDQVAAAVALGVQAYADDEMPPSAMCLYHAVLAIEEIRARGVRAILQAGTASWRYRHRDQDDGQTSTHFGYEWSPLEAASRAALAADRMPEMHVWAATVDPVAIVDFTTGLWPEQARRLQGLDWTAARPPRYLWGAPVDASYIPHHDAVVLALDMAARVVGVRRAMRLVS